jgi:hypothetical protein
MRFADDHLLAELQRWDSGCWLPAGARISWPDLEAALCAHVSGLLCHDFPRLIALLYRVDVSEKKLREALSQHPGDNSAPLITALVLERLAEKLKNRQDFAPGPGSEATDEEEKW